MRTITNTFNVYSFDELSDEAKENAIDRVRYDRSCLSWQDEAINSIEKIPDEYIIEMIEANGYEFLEDGRQY